VSAQYARVDITSSVSAIRAALVAKLSSEASDLLHSYNDADIESTLDALAKHASTAQLEARQVSAEEIEHARMLAALDAKSAARDAEILEAAERRELAAAQSVKLRSHELFILRKLLRAELSAQLANAHGVAERCELDVTDDGRAYLLDTLRSLDRRVNAAFETATELEASAL
jgi:hypothetical protein